MMANLFSIFEPSSSVGLPLNWISMMLVLILLPSMKWASVSRSEVVVRSVFYGLVKEYSVLLSGFTPWVIFMILVYILFIFFNNFMGLFPYVFTASSHLVLTLSLALPLWLGYVGFGFLTNTSANLAHLTPQGTPMALVPLMVLIESVSSLIRPLTLSVRLAANMIAGHLLLSLMSSSAPKLSVLSSSALIVSQVLLLILESAVAVIQAYVFTTLSVLYVSEINYAEF